MTGLAQTPTGTAALLTALTDDRTRDGAATARAALAGLAALLRPSVVALVGDDDGGVIAAGGANPVGWPADGAPALPAPALVVIDAADPRAAGALAACLSPGGLGDGAVVIRGMGGPAGASLLAGTRPSAVPKVALVHPAFVPAAAGDDGLALIVVQASRGAYGAPPVEVDPPWRPPAGAAAPAPDGPERARSVRLQAELDRVTEEARVLRHQVEVVTSSLSWRITSPVRLAGRVKRRLTR